MSIELPQRDPSGAYRRNVKAARRVGKNKRCSECGESRPEALVPKSNPRICYECERKSNGQKPEDNHHFAGEANHPLTIPIPINDHRAELSAAQYDWEKKMRENPEGCPVVAGAACIQGFADTVIYLIKKGVLWIVEMLLFLSDLLLEKLGPKWWVGTPIEQFVPKC